MANQTLKPGDPFNPWRGDKTKPGCGFYAPEVVGMQPQKSLKDGPKRLYECLVRFAGRNGHCFPSQGTLAAKLGKSRRQIQRDLSELEEAKLIAHQTREGKRYNTYVFLWNEIFEDHLVSKTLATANDSRHQMCPVDGPVEASHMTKSNETEATDVTPLGDTSNVLRRQECRPNSVQGIKLKNSAQSSAFVEGSAGLATASVTSTEARALATNGFEEFRQRYPEAKRGVKVAGASRAYASRIHRKPGEHEKLMAGLARYGASAELERALTDDPSGQFVPSMERYILDRRYLDAPQAAQHGFNDGYLTYEEARRQQLVEEGVKVCS